MASGGEDRSAQQHAGCTHLHCTPQLVAPLPRDTPRLRSHVPGGGSARTCAGTMGCGESKSDAVVDTGDVRLQEAGTAMGAESEREPGAACDVSASPPEGAQAENAWTARAFASSLGVAGAVAEALLDGAAVPAGGEFEFMQSLAGRPDEIEAKLRKGRLVERVAKMLSKGAEEKLKTAEAKTGAELNDKFATDGTFKGEMGFGGTAEYYRGARPTRT